MRYKKASTLIELLIVVVIIGILATIFYTTFNSSRVRARDTRRKQDLQSIRLALVLYKQQATKYPTGQAACANGWEPPSWTNLQTQLQPYITTLPLDPAGGCDSFTPWSGLNEKHVYAYLGDNTNQLYYSLWASLENQNDSARNGASFQYNNLYRYATDIHDTDNEANVYGVGCRIVGAQCLDN